MTVWIISAVAVVLLAIYIWPHLKKQPNETNGEVIKQAGDAKNLKDDIVKSGIYFLLTTPAAVIYFWGVPKILCWLITMTLPWAYVVSALLFVPIISITYHLWGEHWTIGKKQRGFASVALVALAVSLLYIYYPKEAPVPVPAAQTQTTFDTIKIKESGIYRFELLPLQSTSTIQIINKGLIYSFSSSTKKSKIYQPFFIRYERGNIVKVDKADVEIPNNAGPFKLTAGENGANIKLLVFKRG